MKDRQTIRWIYRVSGSYVWCVLLLVLLQAMLSVSGIAFAFGLRQTINTITGSQPDSFVTAMAVLAGILGGQILLGCGQRFLNEYTNSSVENSFKQRLFSMLLQAEYGLVTAVHSGEWLKRLTSDTSVVADGVTQIVPGALGMLVRLIGALAAILWLEPRFFYILVPGGIVTVLLTYAFRKTLKRLHKHIQEADGRLRVFWQERLESMLIVRTFARERQTSCQAQQLMDAHKHARMQRNHFSNICNAGFSGVMDGAYLLGIGFCGYNIMNGTMSYGDLLAIMQLIGQVQNPFANLSGYLPRYYAMLASAERLLEAETLPAAYHPSVRTAAALEFYRTQLQAICLRHACFAYPAAARAAQAASRPVLHDVTLTIHKGDHVAFTGPSGCGKSTLLKLLLCLYPLASGSLVLQTRQGQVPLDASWRSLFAYVPQGNQLLSGSIRQLIVFGDDKRAHDEDAIWRALQIACADGFVRHMKQGLDTVLGERGQGLSEGQLQRLAIARALFADRPILILDESTSALDAATASRLLRNLRQMTDTTVLMVTHHIKQTERFDTVLQFTPNGVLEKKKNRANKGGCDGKTDEN